MWQPGEEPATGCPANLLVLLFASDKVPSGIIQIRDHHHYGFQIIRMNTYSEMFKGFGFDGQLKASFLAGMVKLQGAGAYLKDLKASSRSVKATLKFEVETKYESIIMTNTKFQQCLTSDALGENITQATHFVSGVQWGAHAYASVESDSSMGNDVKGIEGKLSAGRNELGALLLQICGGGVGVGALKSKMGAGKGRITIEEEENFKFRVDADVLPDSSEGMMLPKNFEEAWELLSKMPAQLIYNSTQGKGRPLRFTLYPLSQLHKKFPRFQLLFPRAPHWANFTSLPRTLVESLECLFDRLQLTKQKLHDLYEDVNIHYSTAFSSHHIEQIAAYKDSMEAAEGRLRAAVCDHIIAIRSQKGEYADLEKVVKNFYTESPFAPSKALDFMGPYAQKLRRITGIQKQGVQFVLKKSSMYSTSSNLAANPESILIPHGNVTSKWVVVLTYCDSGRKKNIQEWRKSWNTFWYLHEQSKCGQDLEADNTDPAETDIHFYVQESEDGDSACKTRVSVYRDGDVVSEDTALMMCDPHPNKIQRNLVYSTVKHEVKVHAPNARIPLQTYCPGHHVQSSCMVSCSKDILQDWACERCNECLEYGKDGFFYCRCGRVPVHACRFKCQNEKHGPLFIAFPASQDVEKILERQEVPQQLNILLLGETGVGKSTFVNAFANYLTFESLESATSAEELVGLIPMAFTHTDQLTFETREIRHGHLDANEIHSEGQSSTQACRSYTIHLNSNQTVHLIDTPGVGDTRGIEQDQANFQNILSYLTHYSEIHGICVMLKPNTARLTITFRFCIKELLRHLHKSASENIIFLFTNSRSTFYTPGDTVVPLNTMLRDVYNAPPYVQIAFNQRTVYCMDNESFRFLLASKEGCFFSTDDKDSYSKSWTKSVEQCKRMLEHLYTLKAHNVKETVSLNNAASLVSKLQKPLADVTNAIQRNLAKWGALKKELEEFQGSPAQLERIVYGDEVLSLQAVRLKKGARTVCTSNGSCCQTRVTVNGDIEVFYKQVCHEPCSSSRVMRAVAMGKALWFCKAMDLQGFCKVCKCHFKKHVRITYNTKLVPVKVVSKDTERKVDKKSKKIEAKANKISELEQRCKEWQQELDAITQACARFAHFFKNNAITPYNDDMKAYVHQQIAVEKGRYNYNRELIARWEAFLEAYQKQIDDLERMSGISLGEQTSKDGSSESAACRNQSVYGTGADILNLARSLFQLKHNGTTIKNLVEEVANCEHRTEFYNKTFHGGRYRKLAAKVKTRAGAGACTGEGALHCTNPGRLGFKNEIATAPNQRGPEALEFFNVEKFNASSPSVLSRPTSRSVDSHQFATKASSTSTSSSTRSSSGHTSSTLSPIHRGKRLIIERLDDTRGQEDNVIAFAFQSKSESCSYIYDRRDLGDFAETT